MPTASTGTAARCAVSAPTAAIGSWRAVARRTLARRAITGRTLARRTVTRRAGPFADYRRLLASKDIDAAHIGLHALHSERVNKKWYDNVVIATKYIGPMATPNPIPTPTPTPTPAAQLQNISSRLLIQTENNVGIAGFKGSDIHDPMHRTGSDPRVRPQRASLEQNLRDRGVTAVNVRGRCSEKGQTPGSDPWRRHATLETLTKMVDLNRSLQAVNATRARRKASRSRVSRRPGSPSCYDCQMLC